MSERRVAVSPSHRVGEIQYSEGYHELVRGTYQGTFQAERLLDFFFRPILFIYFLFGFKYEFLMH